MPVFGIRYYLSVTRINLFDLCGGWKLTPLASGHEPKVYPVIISDGSRRLE